MLNNVTNLQLLFLKSEVGMSENNLNEVCNMTTAPTQDPTIAIHSSLRDSVSIM